MTEDANRASLRTERGVPSSAASCHTAIVDGYTIEGHIPVEAIERLLADRLDAVGLALPGMPVDSPGMGGDAETWSAQPVLLVSSDGSVSVFDY